MRVKLFASIVSLGLGVTVVACSATSSHEFTSSGTGASSASGTGGAGSGTGMGGTTGVGPGFASASVGVGGGSDGCSAASQLVYVLSEDNNIWSFDPPTKQFTQKFALTCATPTDGNEWEPNSMAVSREGVAWVNYVGTDPVLLTDQAGVIFQVNLTTGNCEATPTVTLPDASWYRLGMGFSSDTVGGTTETLYVAGTGTAMMDNSPGLGKINTTSGALTPIGGFTGALSGQSAELTGTGDAKLYGFFTTTPVQVAQVLTTNGSTPAATDASLNAVTTPAAWAFSFWGGDFYLYVSDGTTDSNVVHYTPSTNTVDTMYVPDTQMIIVGAGVSTCAPLTPPN
jgi:hypothetical protein